MTRVIVFMLFLSLVSNKGDCTDILDSLPFSQAFEDLVKELLRIQKRGQIVDTLSDSIKDILRYNFGLDNEDKYLNVTQLLSKYGYPAEQHQVRTADGYLLTAVRVRGRGRGSGSGSGRGRGRPVLVVHGVFCSADEFVTSGPGRALAYLLADAGYDAWLANCRGNKYSTGHVSLSTDDERYWNFSFHEMGIYDAPSLIDYILEKSSFPSLYLVGHSQGSTVSYVMLSERPEYNSKVKLLVSLAPVAWLNNLISPGFRALVPFRNEIAFALKILGIYKFTSDNSFLNTIKDLVCGKSVTAAIVCGNGVIPLLGLDVAQVNFTLFPVQLLHLPSGVSTKQLAHFAQLVPRSAAFQKFDYGAAENQRRYGSARPPPYPVWRVAAPAALLYSAGGFDWLSAAADVAALARRLPRVVLDYTLPVPFNHMDYNWGNDAKKLVFKKIFDLFEQYDD